MRGKCTITPKNKIVRKAKEILFRVKSRLSAGKVLATVFQNRKGIVLVDMFNATTTAASQDQVRLQCRRKRQHCLVREVLLFHDNDRPHTTAVTQQKLVAMRWQTLVHPPHSPDLSSCDFHMFELLKEALGAWAI